MHVPGPHTAGHQPRDRCRVFRPGNSSINRHGPRRRITTAQNCSLGASRDAQIQRPRPASLRSAARGAAHCSCRSISLPSDPRAARGNTPGARSPCRAGRADNDRRRVGAAPYPVSSQRLCHRRRRSAGAKPRKAASACRSAAVAARRVRRDIVLGVPSPARRHRGLGPNAGRRKRGSGRNLTSLRLVLSRPIDLALVSMALASRPGPRGAAVRSQTVTAPGVISGLPSSGGLATGLGCTYSRNCARGRPTHWAALGSD